MECDGLVNDAPVGLVGWWLTAMEEMATTGDQA